MTKHRKVLFIANSSMNWMGGVYYVKNILCQYLEYIHANNMKNYTLYVYLDSAIADVFDSVKGDPQVVFLWKRKRPWSEGNGFLARNIRELGWIFRIYSRNINFIYPSFSPRSIYRKRIVSWIPDFQHIKYPEFFSLDERMFRDDYFGQIAQKHSSLILSSMDSYHTYMELYPTFLNRVYVVPFISAIEPALLDGDIDQIKKKYSIENKDYFVVCNQFYRHKNHQVVMRTIKYLKDTMNKKICVVCTGMTNDPKDSTYYPEIESLVEEYGIEKDFLILGMVPRRDQITLLKHSVAVIQPSLFEGWGTVVEDAKTVGKRVILSDIPVHREQGDINALYFEPNDEKALAEQMLIAIQTDEFIDTESRQIEYGMKFDELFMKNK